VDPIVYPQASAGPHRYDDRVDGLVGTIPVVASQVTGIGGSLVEVSLGRGEFSFQLKHNDGPPDKENDVRAAGFQGKFVLENRGVLLRIRLGGENLTDFSLQLWNRIIPGANLFRGGIGNKILNSAPDYSRRRVPEDREYRAPPVSR